MFRDAVLAGPTAAEIVALVRLVQEPDVPPPPHLTESLAAKGWVMSGTGSDVLLTLAGRSLADSVGAQELAAVVATSSPAHQIEVRAA